MITTAEDALTAPRPLPCDCPDPDCTGWALPGSEETDGERLHRRAPYSEWLDTHVETWDMPTLSAKRPEIITWIAERYHVEFGIVSDVILISADGRVIPAETNDVRVACWKVLDAATRGETL